MQDYRLRKGDRVMTHTPLMHIPVGTRGTVVMVYFVVDDCYDIQLDGYRDPRLMFGADLQLVSSTDIDPATRA
jgi:hypothetical protein